MNTRFKNKFSEPSKVLSLRVPESQYSQIKTDVNKFITVLLKDEKNPLSLLLEGINDSLRFLNDFLDYFKLYKSLKARQASILRNNEVVPLMWKLHKCLEILT